MTPFPLVKLIEINQAEPTHVKLSHGRDATLAERVPKQHQKLLELHLTTSNLGSINTLVKLKR